jgi:hypothetical protein
VRELINKRKKEKRKKIGSDIQIGKKKKKKRKTGLDFFFNPRSRRGGY